MFELQLGSLNIELQVVNEFWWYIKWVSDVLRPHQHSIGYTGDGFYRSKDPTNSIKVLKEMLQKTKKTMKTTKQIYVDNNAHTKRYTQNKHSKSPSLQ